MDHFKPAHKWICLMSGIKRRQASLVSQAIFAMSSKVSCVCERISSQLSYLWSLRRTNIDTDNEKKNILKRSFMGIWVVEILTDISVGVVIKMLLAVAPELTQIRAANTGSQSALMCSSNNLGVHFEWLYTIGLFLGRGGLHFPTETFKWQNNWIPLPYL